MSNLSKTSFSNTSLQSKVEQLEKDINQYLPADGKGVSIATAWLNTDNLIVAFLSILSPSVFEGVKLVAVDTLHLFKETHEVSNDIQSLFKKPALITKPKNASTLEEFKTVYGDCELMPNADFEYASKVEPFSRGLIESGKEILITGRRADQGAARIELAIWEQDKKTFNPLADWTWEDVCKAVDILKIPYNTKHNLVYRASQDIPANRRHLEGLPWEEVDLKKPYWQATDEEIYGSPRSEFAYVWKSFGDFHSSVVIPPAQSERSGRFVRLMNTECGIHTRATFKGQPHGGVLMDLMEKNPEKRQKAIDSCEGRVFHLDERSACDVELLINGGFSPLNGFMTEKEYLSVVNEMRLPELQLFSVPVVLHTNDEEIQPGQNLLLKYKDDLGGEPRALAVFQVSSKYVPDKVNEALKIFQTTGLDHPGVKEIALERGKYYLGGRVIGLDLPRRHIPIKTPRQVRDSLPKGNDVVMFQCRNPIHRAHYELFTRIPSMLPGAVVLVHPTCGPTQDGDIDWRVRFETYEVLQKAHPNPAIGWAYLPYSMHMAGPREAIQHMIVRKNFGATHFIIGRDMAGCKSTVNGTDFYGPYDAQIFAERYSKELGVTVVPFKNLVYTEEKGYVGEDEAQDSKLKSLSLSGTEFRKRLLNGDDIPEWFSFPEVVAVLREAATRA